MYATLCLLAVVGFAAANPAVLLPYATAYDDGQWHPELDGSIAGSGLLRWEGDDGQWKPELDGSVLGRGDLTWLNRRKRSAFPQDEPITAYAKNAHLIQQQTEATRNILGGGIPLHLPADTPEVAAGKQAHAIAHENQKLATAGYYAPYAAYGRTAVVAPYSAAVAPVVAAPAVAAPVGPASGYPHAYGYAAPAVAVTSPYYPGLPGLRTIY